jgi:sterol desaturase/sphingolipid hydroxylase (fatty acid hydroxylase superfamily)
MKLELVIEFFTSKAGIVIFAVLLLALLERIFPAVILRENVRRLAKNFSLATLNILLSPFIVVPISVMATQYAVQWRPPWASGLPVDLLLLDCWIYIWHRANHRIALLWRFHIVHHLDERLDVSSAVRFHFGEVVLSSVVRAAIIFILAVPMTTIVVFETLVTVAALFHHSNIRIPSWLERPLSLIIVTPSIHFVHHHALQADTDSNYSTILSVWDRLFGSRSATQRTYDLEIGVEGLRDVPILRLILRPFYKA